MSEKIELTDDMIAAIETIAKKFNCLPQSVLKRMVFGYAAEHAGPVKSVDTTNLVSIGRDE